MQKTTNIKRLKVRVVLKISRRIYNLCNIEKRTKEIDNLCNIEQRTKKILSIVLRSALWILYRSHVQPVTSTRRVPM